MNIEKEIERGIEKNMRLADILINVNIHPNGQGQNIWLEVL